MAKFCVIKNNGYWYKGRWEPSGSGLKFKKYAIKDKDGNRPRSRTEAIEWILREKETGSETSRELTLLELIPIVSDHLRGIGKSELTIKVYAGDVTRAAAHLPEKVADIKHSHIINFIDKLPHRPQTKQKYAKSLSRFFDIVRKKGYIQENPVQGFEFTSYSPDVLALNEPEILRLLKAAEELSKLNQQYYPFMVLSFQTGLRLNEYVNLRWQHLDPKTGAYTIFQDETFQPKFGRKRIITIQKLSLGLIKKLPRECDYIFHKNGKKYNRDHFCRDFSNNIFKAAGVRPEEDHKLHLVRKTFASYRLACGQPMQNLKQQLGHSSLKELEAYVGVVQNPSQKMRDIFGCY